MRDLTAGQQLLLLAGLAVIIWWTGAALLRWTGGLLVAAGAVTLAQGAALGAGTGVLVTGLVIWALGRALGHAQHGDWRGSEAADPSLDLDQAVGDEGTQPPAGPS